MPCDVNNLTITEPNTPGIPGLGPVAPIQLPFPDVALPEGFPENLLDLIEQFLALFPSNIFKPNLNNFSKNVLDAISNLMSQIAPYLGLYRFFIALLNMIICIITVLCSAANPFAMLRALKALFRKCLPDFLNLFPWLALIAMIIALLLLLLAIIEYIIAQILRLIAEIIRNIQILTDAIFRNDAEKTLAAIRKIASLMCLMENLFAILLAFGAVFEIIRALAGEKVSTICGDDNKGVDAGCCPEDVCPEFISQNEGVLTSGLLGRLIFHVEVEQDTSLLPVQIFVSPSRDRRYQFVDTESNKPFNLIDIATENPDVVFFPDIVFKADSDLRKVPYTLDIRFYADSALLSVFDISGDPRYIRIKDMRIKDAPYTGTLTYNDALDLTHQTGTVLPTGGVAYEDDDITPVYDNSSKPASLETLLTRDAIVGMPSFEDGYFIDNVEFSVNINEESLVGYSLISNGCVLRADREVINNTLIGNASPPIELIDLPDIDGAVDCLLQATQKFRNNLSIASAAEFQAEAEACLDGLKDEALNAYEQAVVAGFNQYKSTLTVSPDIQFVNNPIKVIVNINDQSGTSLLGNMPAEAVPNLASKVKASITLGEISAFEYDSDEQAFVAYINSKVGGNGKITATFDGETFNKLLNTDSLTDPITIEETVASYTFVAAVSEQDPGVRRDEGDVARDEG